jgi:endonuclease-3
VTRSKSGTGNKLVSKKRALKKRATRMRVTGKRAAKESATEKRAGAGNRLKPAGVRKSEGGGIPMETLAAKRTRAGGILTVLRGEFPGAITALRHDNPFQLLIATILSAQCTDERVNMVTPTLFAAYPGPGEFARANQADIEEIIRSTGFFRNKTKSILACSSALLERHGGHVPDRMEELVTLPGVGRKTANVVLGQAFGIASGVVVDTHVQRLAGRLGLSAEKTPEKIEADLMQIFPPSDWIEVSSILILHGRKWCNARRPRCAGCPVRSLCPSADSFGE